MDRYRVHSRYDKHSHKPYVIDVVDKYSGEVVYCLHFAIKPDWDNIVAEVQRLDGMEEY